MDAWNCFYVTQYWSEETFLLFLLLLDEDVFLEKSLEGYSFTRFPGEELSDEEVDCMVFYVLINYLVYFWLVHVLDADGGTGEEPEPDFTDMPHELVLGGLVIFILLWIVAVISFLHLLTALADGMTESPDVVLSDDVGERDLAGSDEIESEMYECIHDPFDSFDRLFLVAGYGLIVFEADLSFFFIVEDVGLVGPIEEIHEIFFIEGQGHLNYLFL